MDELANYLHDRPLWCILFADNITLVGKTLSEINYKLELWRQTLKTKDFILSRTKTKYSKCKFSNYRNRQENILNQLNKNFRYIESIIHQDEEIMKTLCIE